MKVLVLQGGDSPEREVSLNTGRAIADALASRGHRAVTLDPMPNGRLDAGTLSSLLAAVTREAPDVVFIALHGGSGEDGHIQALLDLAGIPYTGSGMLGSALAMDKSVAKELFERHGVPTPPWRALMSPDVTALRSAVGEIGGLPVVVKPVNGGSTVGTTIVRDGGSFAQAIEEAVRCDRHVLVEQYIPGREITVAVLDGEALPVVEIVPLSGFYDYESKYTTGRTRYVVPAELPGRVASEARDRAERAYVALRCRGAVRVDFRMTDESVIFCLEVNSIPGMTATSLLPMAAKAAGIEFPVLVERLCRTALI
jgi:D-alanine-D-alanine ligase